MAPLDLLATYTATWPVTQDQFEEAYNSGENGIMRWLSQDKSRAILNRNFYNNAVINLTLFGETVPIEEAIVDFENGRIKLVSFSLYNRGDGKDITSSELKSSISTAVGPFQTSSMSVHGRRTQDASKARRSKAMLGKMHKVERDFILGRDVDKKKFLRAVASNVDGGIPLLWSLQLGKYPETPDVTPQTDGHHMRLIIAYNEKKQQLIFSDSWSAGHEIKTISMGNAYSTTTGLYTLKPTVH